MPEAESGRSTGQESHVSGVGSLSLKETAERMSWWTGLRPKLPVAIRLGSDCKGLVTGRSLANLGERQLSDSPIGRKQHRTALKESLMDGIKEWLMACVRLLSSSDNGIGRSRSEAVFLQDSPRDRCKNAFRASSRLGL